LNKTTGKCKGFTRIHANCPSPRSNLTCIVSCNCAWPSRLSLRSDLTSIISWWCVTLSAQSKVQPHSYYFNHDGVWPSRLSPRSNLTRDGA